MSTALPESADIVLTGAGIMSATLGTVLKELEPSLRITIFEALEDCAQESSQAWNNAGTGHAANCELNYTPERADGSVEIAEALKVNTEFDLSRQLWSYLIRRDAIPDPRAFIHPCPHMSFVWGRDNARSCASVSRRCPPAIATTAWSIVRTAPRLPTGRR